MLEMLRAGDMVAFVCMISHLKRVASTARARGRQSRAFPRVAKPDTASKATLASAGVRSASFTMIASCYWSGTIPLERTGGNCNGILSKVTRV